MARIADMNSRPNNSGRGKFGRSKRTPAQRRPFHGRGHIRTMTDSDLVTAFNFAHTVLLTWIKSGEETRGQARRVVVYGRELNRRGLSV